MLEFKQKFKENMLLPSIFIILFLITFLIQPVDEMFQGFLRILTSPSVLLSDYLLIGGLAATLFNVSTTLILNVVLLKYFKIKMTGPIFACLLTIAGFAFFGKNLINALPMYFGIYLYSLATKTEFKNHIIVMLLSSGISPIVSFLMFGIGLEFYFSIPLAVAVGVIVGFILPAFNSHALRFHQGYNLYNTGFSMGVISMLLTGILTYGFKDIIIETSSEVYNGYHTPLLIATIVISLLFLVSAFVSNPSVFKKYPLILKKSGRLVTDFVRDGGKDVTMMNIGFMGLLCVLLVVAGNIKINGPVMGAILTVLGFSAFGKHPRNSIPVVLGAILAIWLTPIEWTIGPTLAVFFVTGLAPLAGRFGFFAGVLAGFLHLLITPLALRFQGGFDLYNNGFAAGFVAAVLAPVFHTFNEFKDGDPQ